MDNIDEYTNEKGSTESLEVVDSATIDETVVTKTDIVALGALLRVKGDGLHASNPHLGVGLSYSCQAF